MCISLELINWYSVNKRELPWREVSDPYLIWISEIILQQTKVNQGLAYYLRFIERFPTVSELGNANEDEVLKYWQGLGYYSRARNLHKAAQQIITDYNCVFPTQHNEILKLAGVGDYTAAAICSFAYNQPFAVVDGNVYRVLSRLYGIETPIDTTLGKRQFAEIAQNIISFIEPGLHNQSIMEFGALQCVPHSPNCEMCPFRNSCIAFKLSIVDKLPMKSKKSKVTNRFFNYIFINRNGITYLQKRIGNDIWKNLYEFPLIEADKILTVGELMSTDGFKQLFDGLENVKIQDISNPMKHVLSHRVIYAQFFRIDIESDANFHSSFIETPIDIIDKYAVSRLMELYLESL